MRFNVMIDDQTYPFDIPQFILDEGEEFFAKLDRDMDRGYQMSRTWVEKPDRLNRCQIVADRILDAISRENNQLGVMMAAYIISRVPDATGVRLSTEGDMLEHELVMGS
ncbi:MAG: hypothetical protein HZB57_07100 [Gammaproteobacteria bacterium]|nr:hypothetical protein [Gammaproteobacteria bacterium]